MEAKLSVSDFDQDLNSFREEHGKIKDALEFLSTINDKLLEIEEAYYFDENLVNDNFTEWFNNEYTIKELIRMHELLHRLDVYTWQVHDNILETVKKETS